MEEKPALLSSETRISQETLEWQKCRACEWGHLQHGRQRRDSQKEEATWRCTTNCDISASCFRGVLFSLLLTYLLQPVREKHHTGGCPVWYSLVPMMQDERKVSDQAQAVQSWPISLLLPQRPGSVETGKDTTGTENERPQGGIREWEEQMMRNATSLIKGNNL